MYLTNKSSAWGIFYLKNRQASCITTHVCAQHIQLHWYIQDYATAKNLCYQWYLIHCITVNHNGCNVKEKYFSDGFHGDNINAIVLTVSTSIIVMCKQ